MGAINKSILMRFTDIPNSSLTRIFWDNGDWFPFQYFAKVNPMGPSESENLPFSVKDDQQNQV